MVGATVGDTIRHISAPVAAGASRSSGSGYASLGPLGGASEHSTSPLTHGRVRTDSEAPFAQGNASRSGPSSMAARRGSLGPAGPSLGSGKGLSKSQGKFSIVAEDDEE